MLIKLQSLNPTIASIPECVQHKMRLCINITVFELAYAIKYRVKDSIANPECQNIGCGTEAASNQTWYVTICCGKIAIVGSGFAYCALGLLLLPLI